MSSSYRNSLDSWLSQLDVKADRVLDIGGSQLPAKGRTKSWEVREYMIADLPEPHVGSPKPDAMLDLNLPYTKEFKQQCIKFDILLCLEVFDYVWNPKNAFEYLEMFLNTGGSAWVSFPSIYPLHQPIEDDALRYMPGGIKKLADSVGLTIKQWIPRRAETNAIYQGFITERMRCAKGEDHNIIGWIVEFTK